MSQPLSESQLTSLSVRRESIKRRILSHDENYRWSSKWNRLLSLPQMIISSFLGTTFITTITSDNRITWVDYFCTVLSIIMVVLTAILNYFKFPNEMTAHQQATLNYADLLRKIDIFEAINDGSKFQSFYISLLDDYTKLKAISPYIRESFFRKNTEEIVKKETV